MLGFEKTKAPPAKALGQKSSTGKSSNPFPKKAKLREKIEYSRKYEEILTTLEDKKAEREAR